MSVFKERVGELHSIIKHNSPALLTGFAIAGVVSTTVLAVGATPKALAILEESKNNDYLIEDVFDEYTLEEIVKLTWKAYIPTAVMATATILCIVGAHSIHTKRTAAIAGLYSFTDRTLKEYQEKTKEIVGKSKERKIKDEVDKAVLEKNPISDHRIIDTKKGETIVFDPLSGRYFLSDIEYIRKSVNRFNQQALNSMELFSTVNDFYDELNLPHIDLGDYMGWEVGNMLELDFSSHLTSDEKPALVMRFDNGPFPDFRMGS